jgi:F0F1-type ATP synthase membrane subunit a
MRSALRLTLIMIGTCAYAGLAILGWGGFRPFFSHPALIALMVVLFALSGVSFFAGGES